MKTLESDGNRPRSAPRTVLVLPRNRSPQSFISALPHPQSSVASQYLIDPEHGIFELTQVKAPNVSCHSWLVEGDSHRPGSHATDLPEAETGADRSGGVDSHNLSYIISKPTVLVATAIDPLFFLISGLCNQDPESSSPKGHFLSCADLLDKLCERSDEFVRVLEIVAIKSMFERRLKVACDSVAAGDERMYRPNPTKVLAELVRKARNVAESAVPPSMDEKFIRAALEVPYQNIQACSNTNMTHHDLKSTLSSASDSQESDIAPILSSTTSVATEMTVPDDSEGPSNEELMKLLRIRTVLSYLTSNYIPTSISTSLENLLSSNETPLNFKLLNERLAYVTEARAEALASRSLGDYSRKRNAYEEDEAAELRAEKKRKKEEEERKKKLESRGLRDLKKVDTTGMKKMSDFFRAKGSAK